MDSSLASILYCITGLLLASSASYVWIRERKPFSSPWFMAASVALLGWISALYVYQYFSTPERVLQAGRLSLAMAVLAVYATYRFTRTLAKHPILPIDHALGWGAALLAIASAATPWVVRVERVGDVAGFHQSLYGWLAPVYLLYLVSLLVLVVMIAFWERKNGKADATVQSRLAALGIGILVATTALFFTNLVIPLVWGSYRGINIGPILVLLVMPVVAFARVASLSRARH